MKILKLSDTPARRYKKHYIVLDQKERMYFTEGGLFANDKKYALGINSHIIAATACVKLNELRKERNQKRRCILVYE